MSPYVKLPGAELEVGPRGHLVETLGSSCCNGCAGGGPCATGDNGRGLATIAVVGVAAVVGAAVLFPRAWRKFTSDLWD